MLKHLNCPSLVNGCLSTSNNIKEDCLANDKQLPEEFNNNDDESIHADMDEDDCFDEDCITEELDDVEEDDALFERESFTSIDDNNSNYFQSLSSDNSTKNKSAIKNSESAAMASTTEFRKNLSKRKNIPNNDLKISISDLCLPSSKLKSDNKQNGNIKKYPSLNYSSSNLSSISSYYSRSTSLSSLPISDESITNNNNNNNLKNQIVFRRFKEFLKSRYKNEKYFDQNQDSHSDGSNSEQIFTPMKSLQINMIDNESDLQYLSKSSNNSAKNSIILLNEMNNDKKNNFENQPKNIQSNNHCIISINNKASINSDNDNRKTLLQSKSASLFDSSKLSLLKSSYFDHNNKHNNDMNISTVSLFPSQIVEHQKTIASISCCTLSSNLETEGKYSATSLMPPNLNKCRLSILGKPLPIRKEVSFLRERILIYNLLQRPKGFWALCYHAFVIMVIVLGLTLFGLSTVEQYHKQSIAVLRIFDTFILTLLVVEFCARTWSSSCQSKYQNWIGFFRFLTSTFRIIDIFIIIASAAVLWLHRADQVTGQTKCEWLRFAQAFQVLRVSYRFRPWRIMASVIWTQRDHLAIAVYMCSLSLIFITFIVYFIEHQQPNSDFTSIPKTLWWGIVSLLTIGYGDMVPATTIGKIMTSILLLICFSSFALPAGILGTGLALKVQEQQRQKHINKRRDPAARLIQCAWRCYASSPNSRSLATWQCYSKKSNNKFSKLQSKLSEQSVESGTFGSMVDLKRFRKKSRFVTESPSSLSVNVNCMNEEINNNKTPNKQEKTIIRFIRYIQFQVARKNFKNAFRAYDINDVIEQYAAGHADVVSRVKTIQSKVSSLQNGVNNVTKLFHDLNYIHYHQIDRLERIINELSQKMVIINSTKKISNNYVGENYFNYSNINSRYLKQPRCTIGNTNSKSGCENCNYHLPSLTAQKSLTKISNKSTSSKDIGMKQKLTRSVSEPPSIRFRK